MTVHNRTMTGKVLELRRVLTQQYLACKQQCLYNDLTHKGGINMYMIRRVARTQPGKAWEVAGYLTKICEAYESNGRNKAQIYIGGQGLPGTPNTVIAEWIQDTIEPNWPTNVPDSVRTDNAKMQELLVTNTDGSKEYPIEFYEISTPAKLKERGVNL